MRTLISGGCKNGKSLYAQRLARAGGTPLYYIATMIPRDAEDDARIRRHRREREGWGFETLECPAGLLSVFDRSDPGGAFLLDSLTALLANEMFTPHGFDPAAPERVAGDVAAFLRRCPNAVLVSDYIYSDALLYDNWTEAYRRGLAQVDRAAAAACENVLEVVNGIAVAHKGKAVDPPLFR